MTGGVDRGIEVGGESGVHDGGVEWEDKTNQTFIQTSFIRLQMAVGTLKGISLWTTQDLDWEGLEGSGRSRKGKKSCSVGA